MHARYRKKATECNPALGGLIFLSSVAAEKINSNICSQPLDKFKRLHYTNNAKSNYLNSKQEEHTMKYFVIATHWDDKRKAPVKYIAGEFDRYMNAVLFRDA